MRRANRPGSPQFLLLCNRPICAMIIKNHQEVFQMITREYADFSWQQAEQLLSIDSPTGYTDRAALWLRDNFQTLGFEATITTKGGVLVDLGGENNDDALLR